MYKYLDIFIIKDTNSLIKILLNYEENNPNENLLEYTFLLRKTLLHENYFFLQNLNPLKFLLPF